LGFSALRQGHHYAAGPSVDACFFRTIFCAFAPCPATNGPGASAFRGGASPFVRTGVFRPQRDSCASALAPPLSQGAGLISSRTLGFGTSAWGVAPFAQVFAPHLRLGQTKIAVKTKWRCPWAILVAPMATIANPSMANLFPCYSLAEARKRAIKEMPGRRSHAPPAHWTPTMATERLMLAKSNIGKEPGFQAD
jgi:hypothetical protein